MAESQAKTDDYKLLEVFPEEVWMLVIERLTDPQVYNPLTSASPILKDLFAPHRTMLMFAKVIQLTNECGYFCLADILSLRLVCKKWSNDANTLLQNPEYRLSFENNPMHARCRKMFQQNFCLSCQVNQFYKDIQESHCVTENPFPSRDICLQFPGPVVFEQHYLPAILELLENFGIHIWYLTVIIPEIEAARLRVNDGVKYFMKLRQILSNLPNLKMVEIIFKSGQKARLYSDIAGLLPTVLQLREFPNLPKLSHVVLKNVPPTVVSDLAKKNPQVENLALDYWENFDGWGRFPKIFTNLNAMCFTLFDRVDLNQLNYRGNEWPLTKLIIGVKIHKLDIASLFAIMGKHWGKSIKELDLKLCTVNWRGRQDLSLGLTRLETFSFESTEYMSLDFTLPMKNSLKSFSIRFTSTAELVKAKEKEREVFILGHQANLLESNAWKIFEKLAYLKFCSKDGPSKVLRTISYTRAEYKAYQCKNKK